LEPFPPPIETPLGSMPGGVPAPPDLGAMASEIAGLFMEAEDPEADEAVDPGAKLPGEGDPVLDLSEEQKAEIARYLCELLEEHDQAYKSRWDREQGIEDAYAMVPDPLRQGPQPHAAKLCSELTKSQVDQAKARIVSGIMGTKPLMRVSANDPNSPESAQSVEIAEATETFLQEYGFQDMKLSVKLPLKVLRACKLGTAVTRDMWTTKRDRVCYYDANGQKQEEVRETGWLDVVLVHNNDVLLWPPDVEDWQDAEVCGHRAKLSPGQFRAKCDELRVPSAIAAGLIDGTWEGADEFDAARARRQEINTSGSRRLAERIRLTEVWYNGYLPGLDGHGKYQFFLHEDSRTLLYWDYNPLHCQMHPYWPLFYKRVDGSAWGEGIGHELVFMQAAASTLDNLEIDNLKVIANKVLVAKEGTQAEALINEIAPGARIASENPGEDLVAVEMGGSLENIYAAKAQNMQRAVAATGLSSILQGAGDPTMKSGADASSVALLAQEGGRKFGDIDRTMRECLDAEYLFFLEILQQFAPNGLFYKKVASDTAALVETIKYVPPRGRVREVLRLQAQAPSAASNRETMKQNIMIVYNLMMMHLQNVERLGMEIYSQENPAGLMDLKREIFEFANIFFKRILELHEIEAVSPKVPKLDPPTPAEQIINQLLQQVNELSARLAEYEAALGIPAQEPDGSQQLGPEPGMASPMGFPEAPV
jgi:hypothetical protein